MKKYYNNAKAFFTSNGFRKTFKIIKFFIIGLFVLILVSAIGLRIYFEINKKEIVSKINTQINDNILGEAKIGKIDYRFLIGFPNVTLALNDVELKDSLYAIHKRPVLKAGKIEVRLNVLKLLKKEVSFHKIVIIDATIDLFKDKNGVSNSNIFKPKKKKPKTESGASASIDEVVLKNVNFISENQKGNKLFSFQIQSLKTKINYNTFGGWETKVNLKVFAKSLAFNSLRGSFVKNKEIEGRLAVEFSEVENRISVKTEDFEIGGDAFNIVAHFNLAKDNALFDLDIKTKILWRRASDLLANNISSKLNKFDLKIPLLARCVIKGDMNAGGDPEIVVDAVIKDDELTTSYGVVKKCSFNGRYTNNFKNGLGFNDANSAVIVKNFKGELNDIPMFIPTGIINNFEKPVATGKFHSEFDAVKLKHTINEDFLKFSKGTAKVNLDFKIDIVDLKLNKPRFTGNINIKNTSFYYKPKNINFQKTDIDLYFTQKALLIKKIKLQSEKSAISMEGRVDNFLNLYYDAPEKMNVIWKIHSPNLDIKQIIRVLSYHDKSAAVKTNAKSNSSSSSDLQTTFSKSQVRLDLSIDKMAFNRMVAHNFKVTIMLIDSGLYVKNGYTQGKLGSSLSFDAELIPKNNQKNFKCNLEIKQGEISNFLASFNNFGIKSFKPDDIKGKLSLKTSLSGVLNSDHDLIQKSLAGKLSFQIKQGTLTNFKPLLKIGKVVFPNRDIKNINFSELYGKTTIKGNLINVEEFKISSNVLNADISGVYSLADKGTNLGVRVPLRNPKDDYKVTDPKAREELRYKGVVVSLLVVDDNKGGTKIKLGKLPEEKQKTKKK